MTAIKNFDESKLDYETLADVVNTGRFDKFIRSYVLCAMHDIDIPQATQEQILDALMLELRKGNAYKVLQRAEVIQKEPKITVYSIREVARRLGVQYRTVWNYVKNGRLEGHRRDNGRWYFTEEQIREFLER